MFNNNINWNENETESEWKIPIEKYVLYMCFSSNRQNLQYILNLYYESMLIRKWELQPFCGNWEIKAVDTGSLERNSKKQSFSHLSPCRTYITSTVTNFVLAVWEDFVVLMKRLFKVALAKQSVKGKWYNTKVNDEKSYFIEISEFHVVCATDLLFKVVLQTTWNAEFQRE